MLFHIHMHRSRWFFYSAHYYIAVWWQPRSQAPPQLFVAYCTKKMGRFFVQYAQKAGEEPGNEACLMVHHCCNYACNQVKVDRGELSLPYCMFQSHISVLDDGKYRVMWIVHYEFKKFTHMNYMSVMPSFIIIFMHSRAIIIFTASQYICAISKTSSVLLLSWGFNIPTTQTLGIL